MRARVLGFFGSVLFCWLAFVPSGYAATQIGQVASVPFGYCSIGARVQDTVASTTPSYTVPAGGGVITSWSHKAGSAAGRELGLKVWQRTGVATDFTAVGQSGLKVLTTSTVNTFAVRIPVQAGDVLGLRMGNPSSIPAGGAACVHNTASSGDWSPMGADAPLGTTVTLFSPGTAYRLNIAANIEPDADGDGFGDESQDQCPTDASTQGSCPPPPPVTPAPTPPATQPSSVPVDTFFAGMAIAGKTVRVDSKGRVPVRISCPAAETTCTGKLTLKTKGKVKVSASRKRARKRKVTLGRKSFTIAGGKTAKVKVRLSKKNQRLLRKLRTVRVVATAVAHDQASNSQTTKKSLKLKAAKKKRKKRGR